MIQRRIVFRRHPERSDCAFAIAQSKDLPPVPHPHSRSNHSATKRPQPTEAA
jgi:hypothetical protein